MMREDNFSRKLTVLFIDDDPDELYLLREAINYSSVDIALDYLSEENEICEFIDKADRECLAGGGYDLILLDLNLPGMDGFEVLELLKKSDALQGFPVIVYTTSHSYNDIVRSYSMGASGFVCKKGSFDDTIKLTSSIYDYWVNAMALPRH